LIQITRHRDTLPSIERAAAPAGLHLVLFTAGPSISTRKMAAGLREYAKHEPTAFAHAMESLREFAHRFVAEVSAGHATGAVVAAGKYGEDLARLAAAAAVPILTEAFAQASELAREFGGIAKPAGAGGGEIGIAMFATPEAAKLFRRACAQPLTPLEGDIEPSGVRCRSPETTEEEFADEDTTVAGPMADLFDSEDAPVGEVALIIRPAADIVTVPDRSMVGPVLEHAGYPSARGLRRRIIPAAVIVLAVVVVWFTFPKPTGALVPGNTSPPSANEGATSAIAVPAPTAPPAENLAPTEDTHQPPAKDSAQPAHEEPGRSHHARTVSANHKAEPSRHAAPSRTRAPISTVRRAGSLSADDF
jgi:hypothetical protein